MKAKVWINLQKLQTMFPTIRSKFGFQAGAPTLAAILDSISKGISPVKGEGRFVGYSETYIHEIKAGEFKEYSKLVRPVNLKLSGEMLASGDTSPTANGVRIIFTDELADIHNRQGAGKSKVIRRLLPTIGGEALSTVIMGKVMTIANQVAQNETRRQNENS